MVARCDPAIDQILERGLERRRLWRRIGQDYDVGSELEREISHQQVRRFRIRNIANALASSIA